MRLTEEESIKLEHKLEVRRILIDKLLLGIVLLILAFVTKLIIANYRSGLTQERFLLENRLSALKDIREAYSKLSLDFFNLANANKAERQQILADSKKDFDKFTNLTNNCLILFSKKFDKRIRFHYWIFQAPFYDQINITPDHLDFLSYIAEDFDNLTRTALWEETLGRKQIVDSSGFTFIDKENSKDFFVANFANWQSSQKNK
jgi:hypothetical protein